MMCASAKADLFWLTWLLKEAQYSNVIEGTVTSFEEVVGDSAGVVVPEMRRDDVREVSNYRDAMLDGLRAMEEGRPLSLSLIKGLHAQLLSGARGESKCPGEFRRVQVHIGRAGEPLEKASYVPPEPYKLLDLLENWAAFLARDDLNPVIQAAAAHAQFEMIHPFLDGNGRMGRLLITLLLANKQMIHKPCLYLSAYLQAHRDAYYSALGGISRQGDWDAWISFFLEGVVAHCAANRALLEKMTALYEASKASFAEATNSAFAITVLDYVFAHPVFTVPSLKQETNPHISSPGVVLILNKLRDAGLIEMVRQGRGKRPSIYRFNALMALLG